MVGSACVGPSLVAFLALELEARSPPFRAAILAHDH